MFVNHSLSHHLQQIDLVATAGMEPSLRPARVDGLNYIVIKSFTDHSAADRARDRLIDAGIDCTTEHNLAGWGSGDWYSVVGLSGFESVGKTLPYTNYTSRLKSLGYEAKPYKWRSDAVAAIQ